jgi:hypothetical protein
MLQMYILIINSKHLIKIFFFFMFSYKICFRHILQYICAKNDNLNEHIIKTDVITTIILSNKVFQFTIPKK